MNIKTPIKIVLDLIMAVMYLLLLDAHGTGLVFHEIAGLSFLVLMMAHILLNWAWVKNVTKNLIKRKSKSKPKLIYVLNMALLLGISTITITGILISKVIFPSGSTGDQFLLIATHKWVSYAWLGLFALHIALHRKYILVSMRNMSTHLKSYKLGKAILNLGAIALIIGVLYAQIMPRSPKTVTQSTTHSSISSRHSAVTQSKDDQTSPTLEDTSAAGQTVSLADFLDDMFCTACGKHCSLLSLRCNKGLPQLESAKLTYQNLY